MEFVIVGNNLTQPRNEIERMVKKMGGKIVPNIHYKVAAVISTEDEVRKMSDPILTAKLHDIQVVSEKFFTEVWESNTDPIWYIVTQNMSEWGGNVCTRFACLFFFVFEFLHFHWESFHNSFDLQPSNRIEKTNAVETVREPTYYTKSLPKVVTYKWNGKLDKTNFAYFQSCIVHNKM